MFLPHLHTWLSHILEPVLRAMAILSSSGLNWVPRLGTGIAEAQAPDSGWAEASRWALEYWSALSSNVFCMSSMRGVSQALCLKQASPSGSISPSPLSLHIWISGNTSNGAKSVTDERIASTRDWAEIADEMKHGRAMSTAFRIPSPPKRTGKVSSY